MDGSLLRHVRHSNEGGALMARKSPWQQFSDNFSSVYGTFQDFARDRESAAIMAEEPEELQSGIGPGPRSQYQMQYGGKIYNEPLSPEKLRGLRNQRLIDSMIKYGDTEGAMQLQQTQAGIDATLAQTEATRQQNELFAKTFQDQVAAYGLQNQQTKANIGLTNANKERILATYPVEKRKMIAEALGLEWNNKYDKETFQFRVDEQEAATSTAQADAEIKQMEEDEMRLTSSSRVASDIAANEASQSTSGLTTKSNQVKMGQLDQQIAVNDMMAKFRNRAAKAPNMGGFRNNEEAKEWMVSEMRKINLDLADEMEANYGANELAQVTQESTLFTEKALSAFQRGGIELLSTTIDELNGLNGTKIVYEDTKQGRIATLYEVDEKGTLLRPIASGDPTDLEGGSFLMSLRQTLDPARAMEISKEHFDNLKAQADLEYTEAQKEYTEAATKKIDKETGEIGKPGTLDEKQYFVARLQADPNDKVALYGLLGMDMTREEIDDMVEMEAVRLEDERVQASQGGPDRDKDGLSAKSKDNKSTEKTSKTDTSNSYANALKEAQANVGALSAGSPQRTEAEARLAELTTVEGLTALIERLTNEIDVSLDKPGATTPQKTKLRNQKTKFRDELIAELEKLSKGLGG